MTTMFSSVSAEYRRRETEREGGDEPTTKYYIYVIVYISGAKFSLCPCPGYVLFLHFSILLIIIVVNIFNNLFCVFL